jgi:hypothetical protein
VLLGFLSLFCWGQQLGINFLHFTLDSVLSYFFEESGFHPFFLFPSRHLAVCNYVLDSVGGGFSHLFSSLLFNFFVAVLVLS